MPVKQKVNWELLKKFIDNCASVKTKADWDKMLAIAKRMDEATQGLAVEHLYLYAPKEVE